MRRSKYEKIVKELKSYDDIERVARKYSLDLETVLVIYTQKMIRSTMKNFHRAKARVNELARRWSSGERIVDLAREYNLPPVVMGNLVLTQAGLSRREYNEVLRNPEKIRDESLRREIEDILRNDPLYSPKGNAVQRRRGHLGEARIKEWLDRYGIEYLREEELRGEGKKTPDFLLKEPIEYRGEKVHWIESKGTFGDSYELRRNLTKQLKPYLELFGSGMAVYWYGLLDEIPMIDGIIILPGDEFLAWNPRK
ncbi:MAG: TPD domain-containing protein [Thermoplasmata archaeon]|nr:TPD domain-containing protein [Thermoplasmata archaeon]